jgi:dihydropyrimidinase
VTKSKVIKDGIVVTSVREFVADVRIENGIITEIAENGGLIADETIDASGCYVIPGGIDTHTHFENPTLAFTTRSTDDFYNGTVAAALGGTTCIIDFVKTEPGTTLTESFEARRAIAESKCVIDFGLHPVVPIGTTETNGIDELEALAKNHGAMSWKLFMAYPGSLMVDDQTLIEVMRLASQLGVLPILHAENGHIVADATRQLIESGKTSEHFHHDSHPHVAEAEAVYRAISIGEYVNSPVYIVHVSSGRAAAEIARAKQKGQQVFGETCPQYLLTSLEDYEGKGFPAAAYVCSPPIRERSNQGALWAALKSGDLDTLATDHAPFSMCEEACFPPQKSNGKGYFPHIPNGVPGVEERLMVMYESGVVGKQFDMKKFVELTATKPAKLFGLYPQKGEIRVGADADIVVWNPKASRVLTSETLQSKAGYTLYEGQQVSGSPTYVLSRGETLVSPSTQEMTAGRGRYLHRTATVIDI